METIAQNQVIKKLKEIIAYDLDANISIEDIHEDISLYEDGIGLDSIAIVNFIVLIENRFNISFEENEINGQLFSSLNNLAVFINTKIN
jgi:acyl carrier protein